MEKFSLQFPASLLSGIIGETASTDYATRSSTSRAVHGAVALDRPTLDQVAVRVVDLE